MPGTRTRPRCVHQRSVSHCRIANAKCQGTGRQFRTCGFNSGGTRLASAYQDNHWCPSVSLSISTRRRYHYATRR
jgi:hypothetical protein